MKKFRLKLVVAFLGGSLLLASCGNKSESDKDVLQHDEGMAHDHENHSHGGVNEDREVSKNVGDVKGDLSFILDDYFSLNKSLVKDDASGAAKASEGLISSLKDLKTSGLSENQQKEKDEIMESAVENAEHIFENAENIKHQREHLVSLSIDIKDLIAIVGTTQKLYEDFCPMADDNNGAIWISNKEAIRNPYMGSKMPECGKISRIIN
ncbi:MAG: hypothetical protein COA32_05670 [Fluviicola sp.]|nr:MAG: hypothetical protein COA32_05670 [Fluviicola sp.]